MPHQHSIFYMWKRFSFKSFKRQTNCSNLNLRYVKMLKTKWNWNALNLRNENRIWIKFSEEKYIFTFFLWLRVRFHYIHIKKKFIIWFINFPLWWAFLMVFQLSTHYLKVLTTNKMKVNKRKVGTLRGTFSCPLSLFLPSLTNHKSHSVIKNPSSTVGFLSLT